MIILYMNILMKMKRYLSHVINHLEVFRYVKNIQILFDLIIYSK